MRKHWPVIVFTAMLVSVAPATSQANSDPNYQALRDGLLAETYRIEEITLKRDVGVFTLHRGSMSFLAPVLGRVAMAVFVGEGEFSLTPAMNLEAAHLRLITGKDAVSESFQRLVLCFTDDTYDEIKRQAKPAAEEARARDVLRNFRRRARQEYETENIEAEILADLYHPARPGFFNAYISGRKHNDLRYYVRARSALPDFSAPEEVALVNMDFGGSEGGIWYLAHFNAEAKGGRASSEEDKRIIDVEHYRIETAIDRSDKFTAAAEISFWALTDGDRVIKFGLLPALRVSRASLGGHDISFIQEKEKADGVFYVIMPEPMARGKKYNLAIEYQGSKVIHNAGGGNYSVGARTSWYPSVNAFNDRATFNLTFKVPKQYTLVSVGKLVKEWKEGDYAASQWSSEVPFAVAGFNYGRFKKKEISDSETKYRIEGYATSELPDYLKGTESIGGMTPARLTETAMIETQNSLRLYTKWFGEAPYGRIAITQQPELNFGQSWPTLVYLPVIAFFDSTQRWLMMGPERRITEFIQELTPHEVAHQWWGHIVGWASFHDQWLSEGIADFSAGLYLQMAERKPDKYLKFLEHARDAILRKNQFGFRPNDAGPIWMGFRLDTYKTPGAYSQLVYPKGGYIIHMLRTLMFDNKTGDQRFIEMMRDFVKTHYHRNASTESFQGVVEKHMSPRMDLEHNGKMDWFFRQWVYGTDIPRYRLDYTLAPQSDGKVILKAALTQSDVAEDFKTLVPLYLDFEGRLVRVGEIGVVGNKTIPEFTIPLPRRPRRVLINAYYDVLASESVSSGK